MGQSHFQDNKITEEKKDLKLERTFLYKDCREYEFAEIALIPWVRTTFVLHKCKIKTYRNQILDKMIRVDSSFKVISDDFYEKTLTFAFAFNEAKYRGMIQSETLQDMLVVKNLITRSMRPVWEKSKHCQLCYSEFNIIRRKHHCRNCGKVLCSDCSPYEIYLPHLGYTQKQRVCMTCHNNERQEGFRTHREFSRSMEQEDEETPSNLSQFKFTFAPNNES